MDEAVKEIRAAAEAAVTKLLDAIQNGLSNDDFETWLINLPEYEEFVSVAERLNEVTE